MRFYSEGEWRFRSTFFDEHGSMYRVIWYKLVEQRLFKSHDYDYDYDEDERRRDQDKCVLLLEGSFASNGSGTFRIDDQSKPTVEQLSMDQIDVSGHWLEFPEFGRWEALTDPGFGNQKP